MSTQPQYGAQPIGFGPSSSGTANTARDGTGTINLLCTGRGPGTRVERVHVKAAGTTTAGMVRLFKRANGLARATDGSFASYAAPAWRLIAEIAVVAITPSGSVATFETDWVPTNGHALGDGEQLGWAPNNAETFNVEACGQHL